MYPVQYLHKCVCILGYYALCQVSVSVSLQEKSRAQALQQSDKVTMYPRPSGQRKKDELPKFTPLK